MQKWFRRSILRFAALVLALAIFAPAVSSAQAPPPPGTLIDVGGHRLHIHCVGEGSPTVVIDAGAGGWSIFYRHIQERVAEVARVCVYDRAGLGWSEVGPPPRTSSRMADELRALLDRSQEEPPFVLVGHSLGGWNARLFAERHPDDVAGIVLVEAAHEAQWERLPSEARALLEASSVAYRHAAAAAREGALPPDAIPPFPFPDAEPEAAAAYTVAMHDPATYETMAAEAEAAVESAAEVRKTDGLGTIPLVVVTARNSFAAFAGTGIPIEPANAAWLEMQAELATLSTDVVRLFSETGDHRLNRTDPDLFVEAIVGAVSRARARMPGPTPAESLRVLPERSDPTIDALLDDLEAAYASMNVERWVAFFAEDFEQIDVNRGVHVKGIEAWRRQTEEINAAHRSMSRRHFGRGRIGDWIVVEIEWSGVVRGTAIGLPGEERSYRYSGIGLMKLANGRIGRQVLYSDARTLQEQLGAGEPGKTR